MFFMLLVALLQSLAFNEARVTVRLKFKKFDNKGRLGYNRWEFCGNIGNCNTFFKICIKPSNALPSSLTNCWYEKQSNSLNLNSIDFQRNNVGLPKVIVMTKEKWPGNIGFYIEVYDKDFLTSSDLMDIHKYKKTLSAAPNGNSSTFHDETSTGQRPHIPKSTLTFELQVSCDFYYFGPECDRYCKGNNDAVNGHYKCDNNGNKVCLSGWFNLPKCLQHCVPQDTDRLGHYSCSINGTRLCHRGWTGTACNVNINSKRSSVIPSTAYVIAASSKLHSNGIPTPAASTSIVLHSRARISSSRYLTTSSPSSLLVAESSTLNSVHLKTSIFSSSAITRSRPLFRKTISSNIASIIATPKPTAPSSIIHFTTSKSSTSSYKFVLKPSSSVTLSSKSITQRSINASSSIVTKETISRSFYFKTKSGLKTSVLSSLPSESSLFTNNGLTESVLSTKNAWSMRLDQSATRNMDYSSKPSNPDSVMNTASIFNKNSIMFSLVSRSVTRSSKTFDNPGSSVFTPVVTTRNPVTTNSAEGVFDDFQWMVNSRKGNLALIGFVLAFVFLVFLVCALLKIYRLKRLTIRPRPLKNETIAGDNCVTRVHNHGDNSRVKTLQMCSAGCFGAVRSQFSFQPDYAYEKQETDM